MKNDLVIYSNSCSFGGMPQEHQVYSQFIADKLSGDLYNDGLQSSCNRRIIRSSLRSLIKLKQQGHKNIIALVGLSFISRTELWQPHITIRGDNFFKDFNENNDGDFYPISNQRIKNLDWSKGYFSSEHRDVFEYADREIKDYYKQWLIHYSKEAAICDLLSDIIMLEGFTKRHGIKFLCFCNCQKFPGLPEVDVCAPFLIDFKEYIDQLPNLIDFWNFSFADFALDVGHRPKDEDVYGINGHPNAEAHRDFANFLLDKLTILKYI